MSAVSGLAGVVNGSLRSTAITGCAVAAAATIGGRQPRGGWRTGDVGDRTCLAVVETSAEAFLPVRHDGKIAWEKRTRMIGLSFSAAARSRQFLALLRSNDSGERGGTSWDFLAITVRFTATR
jgi:hypothetical protein